MKYINRRTRARLCYSLFYLAMAAAVLPVDSLRTACAVVCGASLALLAYVASTFLRSE